jgi:hypothetical protein
MLQPAGAPCLRCDVRPLDHVMYKPIHENQKAHEPMIRNSITPIVQLSTRARARAVTVVSHFIMIASTVLSTHAAVVSFSDRSAFLSAISNPTNIDFATANTNGGVSTSYSTADGLTVSGVNFTGSLNAGGWSLDVIGPDGSQHSGWAGNPTTLGGPNDGYIIASLPAGAVAVGFDL